MTRSFSTSNWLNFWGEGQKFNKPNIEKNTQNKIIKALNQFLAVMAQENKCEEAKRCPVIPKHELNKSDASSVISEAEIEEIYKILLEERPRSADIFLVMAKTGLRISEALGLCMQFITKGPIEGTLAKKVHQMLERHALGNYFGYICLESQPANRGAIRDKNLRVPRKPLKGRKKIEPKWFRYIPIFEKDVWKIIARRWNSARADSLLKKFGTDPRDYLLFDGLTYSNVYSDIVLACKIAKIEHHHPHDARHSFTNWFYGATFNDENLAEIVVGHRDKETRETYSHLAEQIGNEMKARDQQLNPMELEDLE